MKAHTLLTKAAAGLGTAALALVLGGCSHHNALAGQDSGEIRTEQAAQAQATSSDQVVANAPVPANAQGATGTTTPAIISGPAKVDNSGRLYTSSSVGSAGNASATGLNTNVNIVPKANNGTVTVNEVPAPTVTTTTTTVETTPVPAPVVETVPAPAPVVETPAPMTSSTTETTTTTTQTTHRRLRKD